MMKRSTFLGLAILGLFVCSCNSNATLDIKTNVKEAEVLINGALVGKTPLTTSVEAGQINLTIKKNGYSDYKTTLTLEVKSKKAITANMRRTASVTFEVNANVDDAEVYLNNKLLGNTPLSKKLRPGRTTLTVRKAGYGTYTEELTLTPNSAKIIDAILLTDIGAIQAIDELSYQEDSKGTFTDTRDGKQYQWLKIKNKIWMVENLNYRVRNRSWCYDKDPSNCDELGRLYSQRGAKEAADFGGWRLPTDGDWKELFDYYDASSEGAYSSLKDGGSLGFNANFGGNYNYFSQYADKESIGYYWSSSKDPSCKICGFSWVIDSTNETVYRNTSDSYISMGFSVRLVRDI